MVVFNVDSDKFDEYIKISDEVRELLNEAYEQGKELTKNIEDEKEWTGEAYEKFKVYMELIVKYQKFFTDSHEDNPLQMSKEADKVFLERVHNFKDTFEEYINLEAM